MALYTIPRLVYQRARKLRIPIAPSERKGKKLAAIVPHGRGERIVHFGARGYVDYPTLLEHSKPMAEEARRRFKSRFASAIRRAPKYSAMWLADKLLW